MILNFKGLIKLASQNRHSLTKYLFNHLSSYMLYFLYKLDDVAMEERQLEVKIAEKVNELQAISEGVVSRTHG